MVRFLMAVLVVALTGCAGIQTQQYIARNSRPPSETLSQAKTKLAALDYIIVPDSEAGTITAKRERPALLISMDLAGDRDMDFISIWGHLTKRIIKHVKPVEIVVAT